jgi:hypothetical protein
MTKQDDWRERLEQWLGPFLSHLNKKQAHWAPFYLRGLMSEGRRKSKIAMTDALRQDAPVRRMQSTALMNRRLS